MKVEIHYSKQSVKFINSNPAIISKLFVKEKILAGLRRLLKTEDVNIDIKALKGNLRNYYRIRSGKIRIIFKIEMGIVYIVFVERIDFRGNVYKK